MLRWSAEIKLAELIRRYYTGEAGLWEEIRRRVDDEVRQRHGLIGAYHFRFRPTDAGYDVIIEDASKYVNE